MKQKTVKSEDIVFICGACGYESELESYVKRHETKHGRSEPFEVGMEVRYTTSEIGSDHGKDYTYGQEHQGKIVRFEDHDPNYGSDEQFDDGRYALVESGRGSRVWVGEFELEEINAKENARAKVQAEIDAQKKLVGEWDDADNRRQSQYGSFSASTDF